MYQLSNICFVLLSSLDSAGRWAMDRLTITAATYHNFTLLITS